VPPVTALDRDLHDDAGNRGARLIDRPACNRAGRLRDCDSGAQQ
jgi:hypothetical protein